MKLGANNVTPESWVDYAAIALGLSGVLLFGIWQAGSFAWAWVTGRGDTWK